VIAADPSSFRDPSGRVYEVDGRIFRTIAERAAEDYRFLRRSGVLERLAADGRIIAAQEVDPDVLGPAGRAAAHVLEHPRLPFVSYPYEWPFSALKAAALLHLDLQIELLAHDIALSDASAYNVQFVGPRPVFIDLLSLRRYREGELWPGHRQFCEQFLNPLLLRAALGIPHNAWYRGSLEGIPTQDLARLLPLRRKLSWRVMTYVVLQARLHETANDPNGAAFDRAQRISRRRALSRAGFLGILTQLRDWVAGLEPADTGRTVWADYARTHGYGSEEEAAKRAFVAAFAAATKPRLVWDLGCNTGEYAKLALAAGAAQAIGFDSDQSALERAFARAQAERLNLLPLFQDAANPSPDQGWRQSERPGLQRRRTADALLALAVEHHLAIGRNLPLDQVVGWLVGLAPRGVVEFVQKDDPAIRRMLALREDVFDDYDERSFTEALGRQARVVREATVSATGRRLFWYDRG
jgi:ribosomal protein L11 methylase PrmA